MVNSVSLTQVEVISRTIVRITSEEGNPEMSVQAKIMMMMTYGMMMMMTTIMRTMMMRWGIMRICYRQDKS